MSVTDIRSRHETTPLSEAAERLREEANPRQVAAVARSMDPEMLRCRRLRSHKWEPATAAKVRGGFSETLVCQRCGSEKERFYNSRGRVTDYGNVKYPDGYLLVGMGRLGEAGRDVINLASLRADIDIGKAKAKTKTKTKRAG